MHRCAVSEVGGIPPLVSSSGSAPAYQPKVESETEAARDFGSGLTQMGSCRTLATMHWRLNADRLLFDIHGLDIHKLLDAEAGKLATVTAVLYPAKW